MPTASDKQRELMNKWFGDYISEEGPIKLLESHRYILTRQWLWIKPVPSHKISEIEKECICFLIDEWDFGGIING